MSKDSKLWEQAYENYKERFPKSKHNKHSKVTLKSHLGTEPMILLEKLRDVEKEIKILQARRKAIREEMKQQRVTELKRDAYFERPILLYALELENNCWYIGMSRNVERRFKAHLKGKTLWTKEHPPLAIHEVRETGVTSDSEGAQLEDEMTLEYAKMYGIDKVRGGGYCQRKPRWPEDILEPDMSWVTA